MLDWFLRAVLKAEVFPRRQVDRGAADAITKLLHYSLIFIGFLLSVSLIGFDLQSFVVLGGALGIGIGFGLQNIVNNFVSGLILLFERPVRTGDWISVGSTEGYVKKISIRSTEIQTFDRAEVIVPNSDLISQQVTNFMLHDTRGRIKISVGVAYGSDVYQVRDLLLKACSDHPLVITDGSSPAPKVLFRTFGESSLDFELR